MNVNSRFTSHHSFFAFDYGKCNVNIRNRNKWNSLNFIQFKLQQLINFSYLMKTSIVSFSFQDLLISKSNFSCRIIFFHKSQPFKREKYNFQTSRIETEDFAVVSDAAKKNLIYGRNDSIWLNEIFISNNSRIFLREY